MRIQLFPGTTADSNTIRRNRHIHSWVYGTLCAVNIFGLVVCYRHGNQSGQMLEATLAILCLAASVANGVRAKRRVTASGAKVLD